MKIRMTDSRSWVMGLGAFALGVTLLQQGAQAADSGKLTYFTWSGYELPQFHSDFEKAHAGQVDISVFGDDDDALSKARAGFHPDLAHPCYDKLDRWKQAGLIQPLDPKRLKNRDQIFPVLQKLPGIVDADGKVWMVPWDWGNTSILYRTDLVKNPEATWKMFFDPASPYAGKMATIDAVHDTPLVAALLAGVDPFKKMDDKQLEKVGAMLRQQRPLMSSYTTDMTSVEQSLASGELVAAMAWNASATALKKQNVPVAFMKPKEGMLTWVCGMVMLKDAKHVDLAYDFINARMNPDSGASLINEYGYGSASQAAFRQVPAAKLEELSLPNDPETMLRDTVLTRPIPSNDELAKLFERVKAGG
jgi:spermidine/putrescine transport system substrate-binding protein